MATSYERYCENIRKTFGDKMFLLCEKCHNDWSYECEICDPIFEPYYTPPQKSDFKSRFGDKKPFSYANALKGIQTDVVEYPEDEISTRPKDLVCESKRFDDTELNEDEPSDFELDEANSTSVSSSTEPTEVEPKKKKRKNKKRKRAVEIEDVVECDIPDTVGSKRKRWYIDWLFSDKWKYVLPKPKKQHYIKQSSLDYQMYICFFGLMAIGIHYWEKSNNSVM